MTDAGLPAPLPVAILVRNGGLYIMEGLYVMGDLYVMGAQRGVAKPLN